MREPRDGEWERRRKRQRGYGLGGYERDTQREGQREGGREAGWRMIGLRDWKVDLRAVSHELSALSSEPTGEESHYILA